MATRRSPKALSMPSGRLPVRQTNYHSNRTLPTPRKLKRLNPRRSLG